MPTRIVVLTRAWPYPPGEQFVSGEASFWPEVGCEVVVMPWWAKGQPVAVPAGVHVDLTLAHRTRADEARAAASALLEPVVRQELAELGVSIADRAQVMNLVRTARGALLTRDLLRRWTRRNGQIDVIYSYWFDSWTLGALLLKGDGVGAVAARVHGYDLYEDRHPVGRHALRRRLVDRLDLLLPVASSGGEYAVRAYGIDPARVHHAPLGVDLPDVATPASPPGGLCLLSVSSCLPVKRLDRVVDALGLVAEQHPELPVRWTHLGGGPLLEELRQRAQPLAGSSVTVDLRGQASHGQVLEFLSEQAVDLFLNTSQNEGVPVAVMEAMAAGVPVVAPRVGAMHEIVPADGSAGTLLSSQPEPAEVAAAMWSLRERCKQPQMREAARLVVARGYLRQANHQRMLGLLTGLAK